MLVKAGPETPTVNFNDLKDILLSNDLSRLEELDWISKGLRFLDGKVNMKGNVVALTSWPRTGNSFCRRFIELCTGIYTGSDMNAKQSLMLQMMGMAGEQTADDTVWITKTHHSLKMPFGIDFKANKQICIVRNPIDIFPSMANLLNSGSHSLVPKEKFHEDLKEFWNGFIERTAPMLAEYHRIMTQKVATTIPTYYITYEDLKRGSEPVVLEMFRFLLDVPSIEGTVAEAKIKAVCSDGNSTKTTYALKSTSSSLNRNAHMYTEA